MPAEVWYVHIQGETFGPVSTEVVSIMLRQNRLQFSDFVWTDGMTKWTRLGDLHQFAPYLPAYPAVPIPTARPAAAAQPAPPPAARPAVVPPKAPAIATPISPPQAAALASTPAAPPPAAAPGARNAPRAESPLKAWIRRYGRVVFPGIAVIEGFGTFETIDISEGGLFVKSPTPIPFGTELKFRVESDQLPKPLDMTGLVIREGASENGQFGFAIQFTRVNPAHRRVIHEYVKAQTSPNVE